jgi:hypothetical protein
MSASTYVFDPTRPILRVNDTRVNNVLLNDPLRCASISEYAAATGHPPERVMELFGDALDEGQVGIEIWGDEMFLMTSPRGRFIEDGPQIAPNLWEVLRENAEIEYAYALWRLVRGLERGGWQVETAAPRILFGLGPLRARPYLGVRIGNTIVPVLVLPSSEQIAAGDGLLAEYERAGAAAVALVCESGALDEVVTAVRRFVLGRSFRPSLSVLVLEAPRFHPTLLSPDDAAVTPRTVSRVTAEDLGFERNPSAPYPGQPAGGTEDGGYGWH